MHSWRGARLVRTRRWITALCGNRQLHFRTLNSGSVASILKNNLDQLPLPGDEPQRALPLHENIRGGGYYH